MNLAGPFIRLLLGAQWGVALLWRDDAWRIAARAGARVKCAFSRTLLGMLRAVRRLTVEGLFRTEVRETYPLEQVQAAIAASLAPGRTGKVMLRLAERTPTHHFRQTTSFAE